MRVVLTGCNGYVGKTVGAVLVEHGHTVLGVDVAPAPRDGERHAFPVLPLDLSDPLAIYRALEAVGLDPSEGSAPDGDRGAVVHLANLPNPSRGTVESVLRHNLSVNTSVFVGAAQAGVGRVLFASSVQAFLPIGAAHEHHHQAPTRLPISEELPPTPSNTYGLSKLLSERMLDELTDERFGYGMSAVSLRLPWIAGSDTIDRLARQTGSIDHTWGMVDGFAYLSKRDAGEAFAAALAAPLSGHRALWTAAADPRRPEPVAELVERFMADIPGADAAVRRGSFQDCSNTERVLGWRPAHTIAARRDQLRKEGVLESD